MKKIFYIASISLYVIVLGLMIISLTLLYSKAYLAFDDILSTCFIAVIFGIGMISIIHGIIDTVIKYIRSEDKNSLSNKERNAEFLNGYKQALHDVQKAAINLKN